MAYLAKNVVSAFESYKNYLAENGLDDDSNAITVGSLMQFAEDNINEEESESIEFTRVNSDIYGNPRYAVHFLSLLSEKDTIEVEASREYALAPGAKITLLYRKALEKGRKIGGKRYDTKSFGGGVVFQSYSLPDLEKSILNLKNS